MHPEQGRDLQAPQWGQPAEGRVKDRMGEPPGRADGQDAPAQLSFQPQQGFFCFGVRGDETRDEINTPMPKPPV